MSLLCFALSARAQLLYVDTTTNQTINGVPIVGDALTNAFTKLNYDIALLSTNDYAVSNSWFNFLATNVVPVIPNGLVTNNAGATISVIGGTFSATVGAPGVSIRGGALTLSTTNGDTHLWNIYSTNQNLYIDGAVGGPGYNLYFGTAAHTIAALNFGNVTAFQQVPSFALGTGYVGTDGGNDYWIKQTICTLDPLTIFGYGGNSHTTFQFPLSLGTTVLTNSSIQYPTFSVNAPGNAVADLQDWRIGGSLLVALSSNATLTVPTVVLTNLTLSTTSPAPASTTAVVWFVVTNAGQAYKVAGCQ